MGFLKASHSFCSWRRSIGTIWASACQRCCRLFTASMRKAGASPKAWASAIMFWRRSKLACCSASKGAAAWAIWFFQRGWSSAKAFSLKWPASRQRSANWCKSRLNCFQSVWGPPGCCCAQASSSAMSASRCALCSAASALIFSSHASTTL